MRETYHCIDICQSRPEMKVLIGHSALLGLQALREDGHVGLKTANSQGVVGLGQLDGDPEVDFVTMSAPMTGVTMPFRGLFTNLNEQAPASVREKSYSRRYQHPSLPRHRPS